MPDDRREGNGDDSQEFSFPMKKSTVATHVLSEREAIVNYATIATGYNYFVEHQLPGIEQKIDRFNGVIREIREEIQEHNSAMAKVIRDKLSTLARDVARDVMAETRKEIDSERKKLAERASSMSPPTFDPEMTPHGGIRLDQLKWQSILDKIEKQEEEKKLSEAMAKGAQQALDLVEAKSAARIKTLMTVIKILGPAIPIVAVLFAFIAHALRIWEAAGQPAPGK